MSDKFKLDATSLTMQPDATADDALAALAHIAVYEKSLPWFLGDLLNQTEGFEHQIIQAAADYGLSARTLTNRKSVCAQYQPMERYDDLSFSHHAAVAYIQSPELRLPVREVRRDLLECARKNEWSVAELRRAAKRWQGKPEPTKETCPTCGHQKTVKRS